VPRVNPKKQPHPPNSYCLTCYYTTSAIRTDTKHVLVVDQSQLDEQLPQAQLLFSQAFCELQQELAQESTRAFKVQKKDPLAALLSNNNPSEKKTKKKTRALKPNPSHPPPEIRRMEEDFYNTFHCRSDCYERKNNKHNCKRHKLLV
jgi:hypothetical protein